MKGQLPVSTPEQYLAALDEPRKGEIARLDRLIRATVPEIQRCIVSGMLAYGPVHYRYASGREGDSARICVASNASAISLYLMAADEKGWLAERYRSRLPGAKIGKSCVRFKRMEDLPEAALVALLEEAVRTPFPGHGGAVSSGPPPTTGKRPVKQRTSGKVK